MLQLLKEPTSSGSKRTWRPGLELSDTWHKDAQLSDCAFWWNNTWGLRPYVDMKCFTKKWKKANENDDLSPLISNPYNKKWKLPYYLWHGAFTRFTKMDMYVEGRFADNRVLNKYINEFMECFYWPIVNTFGQIQYYRKWKLSDWDTNDDPFTQLHRRLSAEYSGFLKIEDVRSMLLRWAICQATYELAGKDGDILDSTRRGVTSQRMGMSGRAFSDYATSMKSVNGKIGTYGKKFSNLFASIGKKRE